VPATRRACPIGKLPRAAGCIRHTEFRTHWVALGSRLAAAGIRRQGVAAAAAAAADSRLPRAAGIPRGAAAVGAAYSHLHPVAANPTAAAAVHRSRDTSFRYANGTKRTGPASASAATAPWRDARGVASVAVVVVVLVVAGSIIVMVNRHRRGIVAERGLSIGADLAGLAETPRVRVRAVTTEGSDRVRLVLSPEATAISAAGTPPSPDLNFMVRLGEEDFGFGLLHEWQRSGTPIALVLPPASRLVRLRAVDDLQHLTLSRIDEA
jgi:hypothetical protein